MKDPQFKIHKIANWESQEDLLIKNGQHDYMFVKPSGELSIMEGAQKGNFK